jgi:hypothetical protein
LDPNLERLIRLQETTLAIDAASKRLAAMPGRRQALDQSLARARADVAKTKDELANLQKDRRKLEGELAAVETRISKYQGQLMEVKTNKEYQAMLHEIETVKGERSALETKILQGMEAADDLEARIREKEGLLASEMRTVDAGLGALKEEENRLEDERAALEKTRGEIEGGLPGELVAEFQRIARGRGGVAVTRILNGLCQACSVRIQPRIVQEARRAEGLVRCDSCRRFLYYVEEKREDSATGG